MSTHRMIALEINDVQYKCKHKCQSSFSNIIYFEKYISVKTHLIRNNSFLMRLCF